MLYTVTHSLIREPLPPGRAPVGRSPVFFYIAPREETRLFTKLCHFVPFFKKFLLIWILSEKWKSKVPFYLKYKENMCGSSFASQFIPPRLSQLFPDICRREKQARFCGIFLFLPYFSISDH